MFRSRRPMNKRRAVRSFNKSATRSHRLNVKAPPRGGFRL
ncbi:MAG: hypothetical protein [Microvirus sp.]|nr:MAG: hypothetical protein [Microvirus sp.]